MHIVSSFQVGAWARCGQCALRGQRGLAMSFLRKLFKRDKAEDDDEGEAIPIALDAAARGPQLLRLERALDALANEMRRDQSIDNPGWRGRINEYSSLAGDAMML